MTNTKNTTGNRIIYDFWDYQFEWTDEHLPHSEFEPLTRTCDSLADECSEVLDRIIADSDDSGTPLRADRYALLRDHHESHPALDELWRQINTVPEWVDWDQIHRGQDIFWRYLVPITNVVCILRAVCRTGLIVDLLAAIFPKFTGWHVCILHRNLFVDVHPDKSPGEQSA